MDDQILIIFGTNIPDTTDHQMTNYVPVAPNVCFCTTWKKNKTHEIGVRINKKRQKNIRDITDSKWEKDNKILIVFGINISDIKWPFKFSAHLSSVAALPEETE